MHEIAHGNFNDAPEVCGMDSTQTDCRCGSVRKKTKANKKALMNREFCTAWGKCYTRGDAGCVISYHNKGNTTSREDPNHLFLQKK